MIEASVERKLLELQGDPDEGLPIRKSARDRLLRQKQAVAAGERREPFEDVWQSLGLEWHPLITSASWTLPPATWRGWTNQSPSGSRSVLPGSRRTGRPSVYNRSAVILPVSKSC